MIAWHDIWFTGIVKIVDFGELRLSLSGQLHNPRPRGRGL